jgi:hypothetical protein
MNVSLICMNMLSADLQDLICFTVTSVERS